MTPAEPASTLWDAGWYRFARRLPSPNRGPRPSGVAVELIVVHSISLPPGEYGGGNVQRLFTNQLDWQAHPYFESIRGLEVSAHFFIERGGALWQFVSCDERAWHAGRSSYRGRENVNDHSVGIELEGLEGLAFESAQYESLISLCGALAAAYPVTAMAGHEHVAPGRKRDPGAGFAWREVSGALAWPPSFFPHGPHEAPGA